MHPHRTLFPSVPHVATELVFTMKSTWKHKSSRIDKSSPFMSFARLFHFGNKKANKWFLISWKKDHNFLFNSFSQSKRKDQKAAISHVARPLHNSMDMIPNIQDRVLFQNQKNNSRPRHTIKTIQPNTYKNSRSEKSSYKNNWQRQSTKQKTNTSTECC